MLTERHLTRYSNNCPTTRPEPEAKPAVSQTPNGTETEGMYTKPLAYSTKRPAIW